LAVNVLTQVGAEQSDIPSNCSVWSWKMRWVEHIPGMGERGEKFIQNFSWKTWREETTQKI